MSADEHTGTIDNTMHQNDRSLQIHIEMLLLIHKSNSSNTESPVACTVYTTYSTADNGCFMRTHRHKDCVATTSHCP